MDRAGRISVLPDLTVPDHPEVFVIGNMMALDQLPGVAEVAMQGGIHAARTILRRLRGETEPLTFHCRDLGSMATIGRFRAVLNSAGCPPGWPASSSTWPSSAASATGSPPCSAGPAP